MRKAFTAAFLILALVHSALASAGLGLPTLGDGAAAHSLLHWQEVGHHHHHDGSVHEEPSEESVCHLHADGVSGSAVLCAAPAVVPAHRFTDSPAAAPAQTRASPFLAGLIRPPRLTA